MHAHHCPRTTWHDTCVHSSAGSCAQQACRQQGSTSMHRLPRTHTPARHLAMLAGALPAHVPARWRCAAPRQQLPPWLPRTRSGSAPPQRPLALPLPACQNQRAQPRPRRPWYHARPRVRRRCPSRACRAAQPLLWPQPRALRAEQQSKHLGKLRHTGLSPLCAERSKQAVRPRSTLNPTR